jgi:hypothetical protein
MMTEEDKTQLKIRSAERNEADAKSEAKAAKAEVKKLKAEAKTLKKTALKAENLVNDDKRAWRIAKLAATLANRHVVQWDLQGGPPGQEISYVDEENHAAAETFPSKYFSPLEDDEKLNPFYESLVKRAESILEHSMQVASYVYACELFEPERLYKVLEIAEHFDQAGWTQRSEKPAVRTLIKDTLKSIEGKLESAIKKAQSGHETRPNSRHYKERIEFLNEKLEMLRKTTGPNEGNAERYRMHELMLLASEYDELKSDVRIERFKLNHTFSRFK